MNWPIVLQVCGVNFAAALALTLACVAAAWAVLRRPSVQKQIMGALMRKLMGGGPS